MPLLEHDEQDGVLRVRWRLDRSAAAVWACLTDAERLPWWLGTPVEHELVAGGRLVVDHEDGYLCTSRITAVDAGVHLAMTWQFPDEPATTVEITLTPHDPAAPGCTVLLVHRGLGDLLGSYAAGWLVHLTFFEAAVAGTPLPRGQFWNLHASLSHLLS